MTTSPQFLNVKKVTVVIRRPTAGSYVMGRWVQPTTAERVTIQANVQPVRTTKELMLLPEGDRTKDSLKLYTTTKLQGRQEGATVKTGDTFVWTDGHTYEVVVAHTYEMGVLNHTKAIAVRKELT